LKRYFNSIKLKIIRKNYLKYGIYYKSASLYLFASIFSALVKVIINPLLAKNLSHTDYAISGYFSSFNVLFLPILTFMVFAYYQRNFYQVSIEKRQLLTNTIIISLIIIGSLFSIIVLFGLYIYFKATDVNFPFWPFSYLLIYQIVFNNFLTLLQVNYRLNRESKKYAIITVVSSLLWVTSVITLVVIGKMGAVGSMLSNLFVAIILGLYSIKITLTKFEFDFLVFKDIIKFCWPLTLSALMWYFLTGVDSAMLERLDNTRKFALYNIGLGLSGSLGMFYTAVAQTFEPDIYKSIAQKKIRNIFLIISLIIILTAIPVTLFIILAKPITHILTSGLYTSASSYAQILSLKIITMSIYYSVLTIIVGFGFTKMDLALRLVGAAFSILMYKFLISNYDFYGAAWGESLSFLFISILGIVFIIFKIKTNKLF